MGTVFVQSSRYRKYRLIRTFAPKIVVQINVTFPLENPQCEPMDAIYSPAGSVAKIGEFWKRVEAGQEWGTLGGHSKQSVDQSNLGHNVAPFYPLHLSL